MLNAIKDDSLAYLYSVDILDTIDFKGKSQKIGWAVQKRIPELMTQWSLFTGGHTAKFIEKIFAERGEIDLCFLDTAHQLPGEILDFLLLLPYMQKSGLIILHDASEDHHYYGDNSLRHGRMYPLTCISNPVLFAVVRADKFKPVEFNRDIFPTANIGALRLNDDTWKYIDDVFWVKS